MQTDTSSMIRLEDYLPPDYLIDTVDLEIRLNADCSHVRALLKFRPNPAGRELAPLVLDGDEISLVSITMDDKPLSGDDFSTTDQNLTIHRPPQGAFTLCIETQTNPAANTKLMGLYCSNGIYCTQCEADGFRRITYFLDRPDVMSIYTVMLEADITEAPVLLANGNCVTTGHVAGTNRHFSIWHDPHPKPAYLFAVVGGKLDCLKQDYQTASGAAVELAIWTETGKAGRAAYAMDSLMRCMRWDEEVFGRNYDLDVFNIVAVSHFNMGAMENKGLNIFNDKYVLADSNTATDQDHASIEAIIAHEYFHNWTGNRITCRDWFQLCLKEGLTVFRDQEFSSDARSRSVKRIADVRTLRSAQFAEDSGPLAHSVRPKSYKEINNFYTPTVYEKGAELIRMLKLIIGANAFAKGMDLYFTRCDGMAATMEDFLACFVEASGQNLDHFARWYDQAGTPQLIASGRYDVAQKCYTLDLAQSTPATPGQKDKLPVVIPVAFGLLGKSGEVAFSYADGPVSDGVIMLTTASTRVAFHDVDEKPVPSLLRGFSAPVRLELDLSDDELITLFANDSDTFNRWQSFQTVGLRALVRASQSIAGGDDPSFPTGLIEATGRFLREKAMSDSAFAAQVLALPSEGDIAREIGREVDPDAIHAARMALRLSIGRSLEAELEAIYKTLVPEATYSPNSANAGRRAFRHEVLSLIMAGNEATGLLLAQHQFEHSDNLTERFGALSVLCMLDTQERSEALASFAQRYRQEPLVLDKWFSLQSAIPEKGVIQRVEELMKHPAFDLNNPNRARSLIGGFAAGNPTQFNRKDGMGYAFVARLATSLDTRNPQAAARILGSFKTWRMLEPKRRAHAHAALEGLKKTGSLSRDAMDIVERALA